MSGKAKEHRDLGEIDLIMACERLRSACGVTPLNKRVVRNEMGKVEQSMDKLKKLHSEYCRKSQLCPCSSDSLEFLREKGRMYNDGMEVAGVLVDEGEDVSQAKDKAGDAYSPKFWQKDQHVQLFISSNKFSNSTLSGLNNY